MAGLLWALALSSAFSAGGAEAQTAPDADWRLYDGGVRFGPATFAGGAYPLELAIDYFTSGSPAVRWSSSRALIPVCTYHVNRPSWISAELFRSAVVDAVAIWNDIEAAVGYDYQGDCTGSNWVSDNRVNEIGWDDQRDIVRHPAAAVTQGTWTVTPGQRDFQEIDIVIDHQLNVAEVCFRSVITHELGHGLGLGHSDTRGDLMFPSFNSSDVSTCPQGPTPAEIALLTSLYGVNRRPTIAQPSTASIVASALTTLSVTASDPDGDPLTYRWSQAGGPVTSFSQAGASISFTTPDAPGQTLSFAVEVFDRFLHRAEATVTAVITAADAPPAGVPSLDAILPGAGNTGNMALTWSTVPGATSYEFCTTPTGSTVTSCSSQLTSVAEMTWDTVLGSAGAATDRRVFESGTRETAMRACNPRGCTATGAGPHAGGLRWFAWQIDYDFFAMRFDVPAAGIRFTIGGVVNLSGPARRFTVYSGTLAEPAQRRILNCGNVAAGATCIGLLGPADGGHQALVTVVSERTGTPTTEHRVRIR